MAKRIDPPLFLKDMKRYYVDTNTPNKSFLKMSIVLKKMGVKNNLFMLGIRDRGLIGVDPFDYASLTPDLMRRIVVESIVNPWYYFREVIRIDASGGDPVPFRLNRANMALIWLVYNNIDPFLTIPRQCGKTIATTSIESHLMYGGGTKKFTIAMLTKDNTLVLENVERLKNIRDNLPAYFIYKTSKDTDNKTGLSYAFMGNRYKTYVAQNDEKSARKICRGESIPFMHLDELPYFKYIHVTYASAGLAMNEARAIARARDIPSVRVITTTAGMVDTPEGEFSYDIRSKCMNFTEKLYDLESNEALHEYVEKGSPGKMVYLEFSHLQLGKDKKWFDEIVSSNNMTPIEIETELLNRWKKGNLESPIPEHILNLLSEHQTVPDDVDVKEGAQIEWYFSKRIPNKAAAKKKSLIMGMDCSSNVGSDFTSFVVIDPYDMAVVAKCRSNETNLVVMASHIANFLHEYDQTLWIPENNHTGRALIDYVMVDMISNGVNPFRRIYNSIVQDPELHTNHTTDMENAQRARKFFGFATTGKSRPILYNNVMPRTAQLNYAVVRDANVISEMRTLVRKNGRIDHADGKNDDTLISYLLACYVVYYGKNLSFYSWDTSEISCGVKTSDGMTEKERRHQLELRKRIANHERRLQSEENSSIRSILEREVKTMKLYLRNIDMDGEVSLERKKKTESVVSPKTFGEQQLNVLRRVMA